MKRLRSTEETFGVTYTKTSLHPIAIHQHVTIRCSQLLYMHYYLMTDP